MKNQQGAPEALRRAQYLTVVYRGIKPGDEARELIMHPKMTASSWSHVMNERDHLAALVEAQQPAQSSAVALSDDLRDGLVAISAAIADQDDRAAQAMLREILAAPQPSTTPQADSQPAPVEVADAMADSQYLAGVSAGWNAANADDPNAALQKLHESRAGYLKPLRAARAPADSVPVARFDDPKVQAVYAILCSDVQPPEGEHWEGFAARRIVDALSADSVLEDAARLDWLALAGPTSICLVIDRPHDGEVEVATDDVTGYGKTLREAIDAVRKQGGAT